jgi:4-amino-4-deoxy-L-arabinose transferase-like glycosyltransferase
MAAGAAISLVSFGLTVAFAYVLAARLTGRRRAGLIAGFFALLVPPSLDYAHFVSSDPFFVAATLGVFVVVDRWLDTLARPGAPAHPGVAVLVGVLLALPFWIRYIGLTVPVFFAPLLALFWWRWPRRRPALLLAGATAALLCAALVCRNLYYGAGAAGHPLGVTPGETFSSAFVKCLYMTGRDWVYVLGRFNYWPWEKFVAALVLLAWLYAVATGRRDPRAMLPALWPMFYLIALSVAASITRIDELNPRFLMPAYPVGRSAAVAGAGLLVAVAGIGWSLERINWHELRPVPRWGIVLPALAVLAAGVGVAGLVYVRRAAAERRAAHGVLLALLVAVPALGRVAFGVRETTTWSPVTLAYVVAQVPKGAVLAVNRSGFQLNAVTLDYAVTLIPFINRENGSYDEAYGAVPWTRPAALRWFIDHHAQYVVFFYGAAGADPLIANNAYGRYPPLLLTGSLPEVAGVVRLADGAVVTLQPATRLRAVLATRPPTPPSAGF